MSARHDASMPPLNPAPAANIAELRFLVVEDHGFQRWMLDNMLVTMGAKHVFSAPDGAAALEIYKTIDLPIDIIVSDLDMPGMDGMEFIRHVGEVGMPVALILASGLDRSLISSVESMARAYGLNLLGAIEKPATAKKLAAILANYSGTLQRAERAVPALVFTMEEIELGLASDQFVPYFLAKVDLETGQAKGAEAVARWMHPKHGVVPPMSFVPMLEQSSKRITELTEIMARKSAAACAAWLREGWDLTVAVNLSLKSLTDMSVADRLTEIVVEQGIETRNVVLEVTESAAATNLGKVLENLSRLRMKGFGLAIDDYGTGYSSMQQLTRIAFTELKIDQSFVRNVAQPSCRAMLESSLEMAAKLRITAVAEGIETRGEWELLRSLGCQVGQGYFIARPMAAPDFMRWMRERR